MRAKLEIFTPYEQSDYVLRGIARRRYLRIFGVEVPLQIKGHTGWAVPGGAYGKGAAGTVVAAAGDAAGGLLSADERGEKKTVTPQEAMRQAEKALALRGRTGRRPKSSAGRRWGKSRRAGQNRRGERRGEGGGGGGGGGGGRPGSPPPEGGPPGKAGVVVIFNFQGAGGRQVPAGADPKLPDEVC